jgi:hypothetical protein
VHTLSKGDPEPLGKHPNITNQVGSRKAKAQIDGTKANLLKMRLVAGVLLQQAAFVFDTVLYALHPIYSPFSLEPLQFSLLYLYLFCFLLFKQDPSFHPELSKFDKSLIV